MSNIIIQFPTNDSKFHTALEEYFASDVIITESRSFDGMQFFQGIVTIALPLAPFVVEFLLGYMGSSNKRVIITSEGEVSLENYNAEEAVVLLQKILESN